MEHFFQAVAAAMIALVLCLALGAQEKHLTVLLSLAACCMVLLIAMRYLEPVVALVQDLSDMCGINTQYIAVILKAVGIGLLAELASLICSDGGNNALGRAVQMLATAAVLWLSIPLIRAVLELIQQMSGVL